MTAPDSFVEQAMRLADTLAIHHANLCMRADMANMPTLPADPKTAKAEADLRALLTRQAARCAQLEEALKYVLNVCPPINGQGEEAHAQALAALSAPAADARDPDTHRGQEEVYLLRAISVMEDTVTAIEDWEDQELGRAIKSSLVDLRALVEGIRMQADPYHVPGDVFAPKEQST